MGGGPRTDSRRQCLVCGERDDLTPESGGFVCEVCGAAQDAPRMSFEESKRIAMVGVGRLKPLAVGPDMRRERRGHSRPIRPGQARQGRGRGAGGDGLRRISGRHADIDPAEAHEDGTRAGSYAGAGVIQPHVGEDSVTSIIADAEADAFDELDEDVPFVMDHGARHDERWRKAVPTTKAEQLEAEREAQDRIALERVGPRKRGARRG